MKTKWVSKTVRFALAFCLILIVADLASAQIPETITYQGRLRGQAGLINDTLDMTFKIYDSQKAPQDQELWSETHPGVVITNGEFTVSLGSIVTFESAGLEFDTQYFLGITVGTDNEMHPRMPFTSVGYAMHALRAQKADKADKSDNAGVAEKLKEGYVAPRAEEADHADSAAALDPDYVVPEAVHAASAGGLDPGYAVPEAAHAASAASLDAGYEVPEATHAASAGGLDPGYVVPEAFNAQQAKTAEFAPEANHAMESEFADYARSLLYKGVAVVSPQFADGANGAGYYTDPVTALDEIDVWCGEPSVNNPCLVKIMPGNYHIDNEPVTGPAVINLEPHVSLEGSGLESTIIRSPYDVILAKDNNDIRLLTIEAFAPSFNTAVRVEGAVTISDVNIIASGVGIDNVGDLHLNDANIGAADGISNKHKIRMHGVYIYGHQVALWADGPDVFTEIFNSKIVGGDYSLENGEGSGMKIIGSSLVSEHFDDPFDPTLPHPTMPAVCAGSIFEDSHGDTYLLDKNCEKIIP